METIISVEIITNVRNAKQGFINFATREFRDAVQARKAEFPFTFLDPNDKRFVFRTSSSIIAQLFQENVRLLRDTEETYFKTCPMEPDNDIEDVSQTAHHVTI